MAYDESKTFQEMTNSAFGSSLNRREFLARTGGGLLILFTLGDTLEAMQRRTLPDDFNAFLRIGEDGRVQCLTGKIEMGQGVVTSLGMMLADELDVDLDNVEMVMGDTDVCPWDAGTWGSLSTRAFGPSLRAAGAEGRQALKELASAHLAIPVDRIATKSGIAYDMQNHSRTVSYAELAKGKRIARTASGKVPLKKPSEFRIMGTSVARRDAGEKVTGEARYAGDIQFPGMLYAKILRGPALNSKLASVDLSAAQAVEGIQVVRDGDFIALLHEYPDIAEDALKRVKATWDTPPTTLDEKTIFDHLLKSASGGTASESNGDLKAGMEASAQVFEHIYYNDYVAHAPIEPHTSVANIEEGRVTIWAATQSPFGTQRDVARELGIDEKDVHVLTPFVGGGFGGKGAGKQSVEAAKIAKLSGKPVQVAWTRKEEFQYDTFRPAAIMQVKSGLDAQNNIVLWDYTVFYAGQRGSDSTYDIPNMQVTARPRGWTSDAHPIATGAWRAPGANSNAFARESQIDIMAAKAEIDPFDFRMRHLSNDRLKRVMKTAANKFGYTPAKAPSGRGIGMAIGADAGTWVASFAEVEVDKQTGAVKVKRVTCVQDMGLSVNPRGATIQMEGCIMMGLGYALTEGIRFKGPQVLNENFDTYELPKFSWMPKIETEIIPNMEEAPQGGGEPAIILMGAIIANAIFDATGARCFSMPMTPERILKALKDT